MTKLKFFDGIPSSVEEKVNKWLDSIEYIEIHDVQMCVVGNSGMLATSYIAYSILYDDEPDSRYARFESISNKEES